MRIGTDPGTLTMTLDKARGLIQVRLSSGGGYNRNAVRLILAEISNEHGRAVDPLLRELGLKERFGLNEGTDFSGVGRWSRRRAVPVRQPVPRS
jgi:hypothetical protein